MCACECLNKWVCVCTHFRRTECSLWCGSVPQGAGIWHIVFVGNSNHLQLSTCFDPFRKFHFLRSLGEWLQRNLWKEKSHYWFQCELEWWLEGQCQPHHCSSPFCENGLRSWPSDKMRNQHELLGAGCRSKLFRDPGDNSATNNQYIITLFVICSTKSNCQLTAL